MLRQWIQSLNLKKQKQTSFYQLLGGQNGLRLLVNNFYNIMENDSYAKNCLELHQLDQGKIQTQAKDKLFMFLSGWLGGPNLFIQHYGHPRMRARHMHISITAKEKDQWLYCMEKALKIHSPRVTKKNKKILLNSFTALAMRIQNS